MALWLVSVAYISLLEIKKPTIGNTLIYIFMDRFLVKQKNNKFYPFYFLEIYNFKMALFVLIKSISDICVGMYATETITVSIIRTIF